MPFDPSDSIPRGSRLGLYEVVGPLGAGGMGLVVRAVDPRLGRDVAIKLLYADAAKDEKRLRRLVAEARAASALNHPNIVTVYEMGESPRGPYIVTELVDGETVRAVVGRGPIPLSLALDIATQTLAGLAKAHEIGIVHRDLKPENLMISRDGFVKILDFGLAKLTIPDSDDPRSRRIQSLGVSLTEQGVVVGTVGYMSPEQVRGEGLSAPSDLFAVSVVMYEMVAGRNPFLRSTRADTMTAILRDGAEPPAGAPERLVAILRKGLAKSPAERYATAREMEADLRSLRRSVDSGAEERPPDLPDVTRPMAIPSTGRWRRAKVAAASLAALAAAVAGGIALWIAARSPRTIDSIAVLPFASDAPATEYLSEGITDGLTNSLSQVRELHVVPRTVAMSFRGRDRNLRQTGKELRVGALLTGRVVKREDNLSVQAELVDASTGLQLWGARFDERVSNVMELQDAISTRITERLRGRISGEQRSRVTRRGTHDAEAYQLYLKGRYSGSRSTPDALRQAIEYFNQSIARDPGYALAWAGLADASIHLGTFGEVPPAETAPRAEAAARKALALDPNLADAHASLATVRFFYDWKWAEAEAEFRRAISLDGGHADGYHGYGMLLLALGRFEEARTALARAQELDPVSLPISADRGLPDLFEGRYEPAIRQFRSTLALDSAFMPAHVDLALALVLTGRLGEAAAEFERAHELGRLLPEAILVRAFNARVSGNATDALKIMGEFEALSSRRGVSPFHAALAYAFLEEKHDAFRWLERGYREHSPDMVFLKTHPLVTRLGADPRLSDLLRRIGLEDAEPEAPRIKTDPESP